MRRQSFSFCALPLLGSKTPGLDNKVIYGAPVALLNRLYDLRTLAHRHVPLEKSSALLVIKRTEPRRQFRAPLGFSLSSKFASTAMKPQG
jgi:hypothetical protein